MLFRSTQTKTHFLPTRPVGQIMGQRKTRRDRIRTAVNVLSDGYVAGIVAHLSKDELERYDAEQGARHPELGGRGDAPPRAIDSQGECGPAFGKGEAREQKN